METRVTSVKACSKRWLVSPFPMIELPQPQSKPKNSKVVGCPYTTTIEKEGHKLIIP